MNRRQRDDRRRRRRWRKCINARKRDHHRIVQEGVETDVDFKSLFEKKEDSGVVVEHMKELT